MNGYIDAIRADQTIQIELRDDKVIVVHRSRFREHLQLARLRENFGDKIRRNMVTGAESILRLYFLVAGLKDSDINDLNGKEFLYVYLVLTEFNSFNIELPFLKPNPDMGDGTQKEVVYDYTDRQWATWISLLAKTYGWAASDIYQMYPEEVACYVQEAIVTNYHETELQRSLSKIAYKYDEGRKLYKFIPSPLPYWMASGLTEEDKKIPIRKDMMPMGNVMDLSKMNNGKK